MREIKNYDKKIHKILKTYDSILVKCKNIPILSDKNIIMVDSIDGMINAQIETKKPVLYFQEEDSVSFMLLDGNETYVYIVKANEAKVNTVEKVINDIEFSRNTFVKGILSKIEKMLLNSNIKNENILTENELKYIENVKEEKFQVYKNPSKENAGELKKKEEANSSKNIYLVPVKKQKKWKFFSKNKAKRAKSSKHERRKKIG